MIKLTTDEFIERAVSVHGNRYDYSSSVYRGSALKITIRCKKHGEFNQKASHHLSGHNCSKCSGHTPVKHIPNNISVPRGAKLIPLTLGKYAIIDKDDFDKISKINWQAKKGRNTYYAVYTKKTSGKSTAYRMHRVIMGITDRNVLIDHIDGNGLNNTKSNLRVATHSQNLQNSRVIPGTSQYKGVCSYPHGWMSYITVNKERKHLGVYKSEKEAAMSYNRAAKKYFGEFCKLNIL